MKIIHVLLFFTFSAFLFAQEVKTIKAKQEKDITYFVLLNHKPEHKPDGKHIFLKGCNWYCEGSVKSIQASSELKKTDGIDYGPKNAHDFDKNTAWIEGKTDYGIGEIKFPANKETKLKFQITQVYKGDKYKNTAISLLMFEGIGGHEKTIVNPQKNLESKPNKS